jgi:hypothetical protein
MDTQSDLVVEAGKDFNSVASGAVDIAATLPNPLKNVGAGAFKIPRLSGGFRGIET